MDIGALNWRITSDANEVSILTWYFPTMPLSSIVSMMLAGAADTADVNVGASQ